VVATGPVRLSREKNPTALTIISSTSMPTAITLLVLPLKMLSFFATKEVRFGAVNMHHLKVGCTGESAIYPKSCGP
jgi:hypothetical protein